MVPENIKKQFFGKKVLVTGASGFIGSRLIEILINECNAEVTAVIRNYAKAMRISRYNIKLVYGDITDKEKMIRSAAGMDYIFHCAYGNAGSTEEKNTTNISGTENLLLAAKLHLPKRLVYLSTLMVYGNPDVPVLTEDTPKKGSKDQYAESKRLAEEIVLSYHKKYNLEVTIIQPTAVYGPWAPSYGTRIFNQMHAGRIALINNGTGIINTIYIDDLITLMLLSAIVPEAKGETFLATDGEQATYKCFYNYFEKIIGEEGTAAISEKEIISKNRKSFFKVLRRTIVIKPSVPDIISLTQFKAIKLFIIIFKKLTPDLLLKKIKGRILPSHVISHNNFKLPKPTIIPGVESMEFQKLTTCVAGDKANKILGFKPDYTLENGFVEVGKWYKWFYNKE